MAERVAARVRVAGRTLLVSWHALERYHELVRPALPDRDAALADLLRVLASAERQPQRPEWADSEDRSDGSTRLRTQEYVLVGDSLTFPVAADGLMVTCIARGAISQAARAHRQALRAKRAQARRAIRQSGNKLGDSPRRGANKKRAMGEG